MTAQIQDWHAEFIHFWRKHSGRNPSKLDFTSFSVLLELSEALIQEHLTHAGEKPRDSAGLHSIETQNNATTTATDLPCSGSATAMEHTNALTIPFVETSRMPQNKDVTIPDLAASSNVDNAVFPSSVPDTAAPAITIIPGSPEEAANEIQSATFLASVLQCIQNDILTRKEKGCDLLCSGTAEMGTYPCTLGCRRLFKSVCDRRRHEETVYPQNYWVCYVCTRRKPSKGEFFIRMDKLQNHNRRCHADQLDVKRCEVLGIRTLMPEQCGLCQHHFHSMADRCNHIRDRHSGRPLSSIVSQNNEERMTPQASAATKVDRIARVQDISERNPEGEPSFDSRNKRLESSAITPVSFYPILRNNTSRSTQLSSSPRQVYIRWLGVISDKGATATVFKVEADIDIAADYASSSRTFAVKQFSSATGLYFQQELQAYLSIGAHGHNFSTLNCFGAFQHRTSDGKTTYNLLLEIAQGDLWSFWCNTAPPTTPADIKTTYMGIFNLADTLHSLHTQSFTHLDIKPQNILLTDTRLGFSSYKLPTWMWADLSHSRAASCPSRTESSAWECATLSFRAPTPVYEHLETMTPITAALKADMWSFGCLLSLAATWMTKGHRGLQDYARYRRSARPALSEGTTTSFHDGTKVSQEVLNWHRFLKQSADNITGVLLDVVEAYLLQADPICRLSSGDLSRVLQQILLNAEEQRLGPAQSAPQDEYDLTDLFYSTGAQSSSGFAVELSQVDFDFFDLSSMELDTTDTSDVQWQAALPNDPSFASSSIDPWIESSQGQYSHFEGSGRKQHRSGAQKDVHHDTWPDDLLYLI